MWVLTYHSISSGPPPLCVAPERLAEQLDFLLGEGWTPVPLSRCVAALGEPPACDPGDASEAGGDTDDCSASGGSGESRHRQFAVTFDDGYRDFAEAALPILRERGVVPTLFAVVSADRQRLAGGIEGAPLLSRDELRAAAGAGVEIGAHGIEHIDLRQADDLALERELRDGCARLADWVEAPVETFAYPFGSWDRRVRRAAAGVFEAAFTTQLAAVPEAADRYAIPRIDAFYLDDPWLRRAMRADRAQLYLWARRWLRRARGSEPRRAIPSGAAVLSGDATARGPAAQTVSQARLQAR